MGIKGKLKVGGRNSKGGNRQKDKSRKILRDEGNEWKQGEGERKGRQGQK